MDEKREPRPEKIAYNVSEAAEALGTSRQTMSTYTHRDDFPAYRIGGRVYIDRAGLAEWSAKMAKERAGFGGVRSE